MSRRLERAARKSTRSSVLPGPVRDRLRAEIRGHLEDAAEEYEASGVGRRRAERLALKDLGDEGKLRTDFGRLWRGRRVVLFPRAARDQFASFLIYDLKAIAIIIVLVVLLRWQVVAAYHIPTESMAPTLHGDRSNPGNGDRILVNKLYYLFHDPARWEIAVFDDPEGKKNLIKRIAGLPGEEIDIRRGDIFIDDEIARKARHVQEELLVRVFDGTRDLQTAVLDKQDVRGLAAWEAEGKWTERDGRFIGVCDGDDAACLSWPEEVLDSVYIEGGESVGGERSGNDRRIVGDLVLELGVVPGRDAAQIGLELREGNDLFEARFPVGDASGGGVELLRNKEVVASAADTRLAPGNSYRIRLANLDDRVTLELDGRTLVSYDVPDASTVAGSPDVVRPATFGVRGGSATFGDVILSRDIYYRRSGLVPAQIPDDCLFMLGDNSGNSTDSRASGPVPKSRLIGRPFVIFWPLFRMKVVR